MAEIKRAGENDIKRLVEKIHTRYGNVDNTADTNKNVASAKKLSTARTITLSGDASGSVSFDGSQDVSLSVTVKDDSHNHIISNIDGLQSALDGKLPSGGTAASATKLANSRTFSITGGVTASGVSFNGTGNVALNVTSIDPSKISGTIPLSKLPAGALERLVVVDDQEAMYALTTAQVQLGDTVQVGENGPMYRVVDESNLDNASGYKAYTAGSASSVPWSGVTGKPGTFTPSAHTHDIDDVSGLQSALNGKLSTTGTAAKATADASGQNIAGTYIKGLSVSGRTVTYTKGDGSTGSFQTQDTNTTYTLSSFGITATAAELNKLDGLATTKTELGYLDGVTSNVQTQLNNKLSATGTAAKATADSLGQNIADTYIKSLSVNGKVITYTRGDGGTGTITTQDTNTTYSAAGTALGLVKSGGDVTIASGVITVNDDSHNHTIANVDGLQTKINNMTMDTDGSLADSD